MFRQQSIIITGVLLFALGINSCKRHDEPYRSLTASDFSFHVGDYWIYKTSFTDTTKITVVAEKTFRPGTQKYYLLAEVYHMPSGPGVNDTIGNYFLSDTSLIYASYGGIDEEYYVNHIIKFPFAEGAGWLTNRPLISPPDSIFITSTQPETILGHTYDEVYTFNQSYINTSGRRVSTVKYAKGVGMVYQHNLDDAFSIDQTLELISYGHK